MIIELETAKLLEEVGFPGWGVWEGDLWWSEQECHYALEWQPRLKRILSGAEFWPAPDCLDALGWLQEKFPWFEWTRFYRGETPWAAENIGGTFATPDELIQAACMWAKELSTHHAETRS